MTGHIGSIRCANMWAGFSKAQLESGWHFCATLVDVIRRKARTHLG
jgi:hypothetical protein